MCVVCAHVSVGRKKRAWWRRVVSTWRGEGAQGMERAVAHGKRTA